MDVYGSAFSVEQKDDRSPLTLADRRSHEIISADLAGFSAGAGGPLPLLSEEGKSIPYAERAAWRTFWLVDPLDGTKEFIKRNGEFTVNIAVIREQRPVLGVIYAPVRETFYFAADGLGSFRCTKAVIADGMAGSRSIAPDGFEGILGRSDRLAASGRESAPDRITVLGSRSHGSDEMDRVLDELRKRFRSVELVSAGSSLKFCMVAEGSADLYLRHGPTMEWDIAAGQVIVEQAGGTVTSLATGRAMEYNKENLVNPGFAVKGGRVADRTDLVPGLDA
jgi:3'(2'), 5'-bisphosphate nucleotidase